MSENYPACVQSSEIDPRARETKERSFRELEDDSGIDHAYIWRLEKGENTNPSPDIITKLSKALSLNERERKIFLF